PAKADAAAVSGLHRNTASSTVPERPGKFLGVVLKLFFPVAGACPIPIQPLQPAWCSRAPAERKLAICPFCTSCCSICLEVGLISKDVPGAMTLPFTISLAI